MHFRDGDNSVTHTSFIELDSKMSCALLVVLLCCGLGLPFSNANQNVSVEVGFLEINFTFVRKNEKRNNDEKN